MMNKLQVIQRAKSYLYILSQGIDPISGESVHNDSILQQERLQKCFAFVADILDEVIQNNGLVSLPADQSSSEYVIVKKKAVFSMTSRQKNKIKISNEPIAPNIFIKNINAAIDSDSMEKLSLTTVNKWLIAQGYLSESKVPTVINRTVKTVTPLSSQIGILERAIVDKKTGEAKAQVLFSPQAQEFILDNMESILSF